LEFGLNFELFLGVYLSLSTLLSSLIVLREGDICIIFAILKAFPDLGLTYFLEPFPN